MERHKFVAYGKLSKKKRRDMDQLRRVTWGMQNPVTRSPERPDLYNRKTENRRWKSEARRPDNSGGLFSQIMCFLVFSIAF